MNNRIILLILLILTLSTSSLAIIEKFDEIVYDKDSLSIDNNLFTFKFSSSSVNIGINDENYILKQNSCKNTDKIKICVKDIISDYDTKSSEVLIYYFSPNITISRNQDKTSIDLGDSINFDLTLENKGDYDANNFKYVDYFPEEIFIKSVSGNCIKEENSLIYSGVLKKGAKIQCSYVLVPKTSVELSLKAQITYDDVDGEKRVYSNLSNIKSNPLYSLKIYKATIKHNYYNTTDDNNNTYQDDNQTYEYATFEKKEYEIEKEILLRINITNLVNDEITFDNLSIILPETFEIISSNMQKKEDKYVFRGILSRNASKEFTFTVKPKISGNYKINYYANLKKKGKDIFPLKDSIDFKVTQKDLEITSSLDEKTNYDAAREMYISFYAKNTNAYADIKMMNAKIKGTMIPEIIIPLNTIKKNTSSMIYKTSFVPNNKSTTEVYSFSLEIEYVDSKDAVKTIKKEWKANINPVKNLEITRSFTGTEITEEDSISMTVYIKNTRTVPIYNVKAEEIFETNIIRNGKTKTTIESIEPSEKIEAYTYELKAPKTKNQTTITIYTNVTYSEDDEDVIVKKSENIDISKDVNIKVNPKKPNIKITKSAAKTSIDFGEIAPIKYSIENKDTETAYNLTLYFSQSPNVDLKEEYTYFLSRIDPGEIITINKESVRPKKIGKINIGETRLTVQDSDSNTFNYTNNAVIFDVLNKTISEPLIFLSKTYNQTTIIDGDYINVTLNIENKGLTDQEVKVLDNNNAWIIYLKHNSNKEITYLKKINIKDHNYFSNEAFADYTFDSMTLKAYAKASDIAITEKPKQEIASIKDTPKKEDTVIKDSNQTKKEDTENINQGFIKNLLNKIVSWFKWLK